MFDNQVSPEVAAQFNQYWPKFVDSEQYQNLKVGKDFKDVPAAVVQQFLGSMADLGELALSQWRVDNIRESVEALVNAAPQDVYGAIIATTGLLTIQQFLDWLLATHQLPLPQADVDHVMLDVMTQANSEFAPEKFSLGNDDDQADDQVNNLALAFASEARQGRFDSSLPQWREATANRIKAEIESLVDRFFDDKTVRQALPEKTSLAHVKMLVSTLTMRIYDQFRKTPKAWTKEAVEHVMTGYFVSNLLITAEAYTTIDPILTAFVDFMVSKNYIRPVVGKRVQRGIKEAAPKMIALAQDSDNYGPAKTVGMAMLAAGLDPADPVAADEFLNDYHEVEQVRRAVQGLPYHEEDVYQPDDAYHTLPHVDTFDGQQWQLATATQVHHQMIKYARLLWIDEDSADMRGAWAQSDIVDALVTMGDAMYAEYLETPETWHADNFYMYLEHVVDHRPLIDFQRILAGGTYLIVYLLKTGRMTQEREEQLMETFVDAEGHLLQRNSPFKKTTFQPHRKQKKHKKPKKKKRWKR
ncbi:hypothetical protein OFW50_01715 [Lacticaseibacillus chiayiensis]|uniref:Uncharacterized protein n=1 Tax=Lacticaseibacillus chiayiensis TaxID=2100821 RepID=A0ABY6H661_9LACO|nr:hypothetical protein [Lacticaseibacillus chiayiensis]UYN56845.1 hypothetical protein OFW50_01715 [Lacticaseibacillus chiayiensis]